MAALTTPTTSDFVVARALVASEGRTLLVRRAAWDSLPGRWELPGGKVDAGETVILALARELEEETGMMLSAAGFLVTRDLYTRRGRVIREHVFLAETVGAITLSDEHDAYAWADDPHALALTDSAAAAIALAAG
jgi:8-oxo-dGTP diphosphatase